MSASEQHKSPLSQEDLATRQVVRRLIDGSLPRRAGGDTAAWGAAAVCDDLYRDLSHWVGPDGCHALFTRALAQARTEHAALEQIRLRAKATPYVDGVAEALMEHGNGATSEAFEALLFRLIELLGRLIGDEMASKLLEQSMVAPPSGDVTPGVRGTEP